jgi:hypothetical protein
MILFPGPGLQSQDNIANPQLVLSRANVHRWDSQSDFRDEHYRTEPDNRTANIGQQEGAESDMKLDIGFNLSPTYI